MDKNTLTSLILESKILHHFVKYVGLLKEDQYINNLSTLKSFLLLFIIHNNVKMLFGVLNKFLEKDVSIRVIAYKEIFITERKEETQCMLSNKKEWKLVMDIYGSLRYFPKIFKENVHLMVSMHGLSEMFSFGEYGKINLQLYENLKIEVKGKIGYKNDYYFLLVFYCIFYQVDYNLFAKFDYFINKKRTDKYFSELHGRIFEEHIEDYLLEAIDKQYDIDTN
jgi:hypothetical protein